MNMLWIPCHYLKRAHWWCIGEGQGSADQHEQLVCIIRYRNCVLFLLEHQSQLFLNCKKVPEFELSSIFGCAGIGR